MMTWQPIETAPKEPWKNVLLWNGEDLIIGFYRPAFEVAVGPHEPEGWLQAFTIDRVWPTHWMPLPEPPEEE